MGRRWRVTERLCGAVDADRIFFFVVSLEPREHLRALELRDAQVYAPSIRALRGTATHFCKLVVLDFL